MLTDHKLAQTIGFPPLGHSSLQIIALALFPNLCLNQSLFILTNIIFHLCLMSITNCFLIFFVS